jgi:hypothetical protein
MLIRNRNNGGRVIAALLMLAEATELNGAILPILYIAAICLGPTLPRSVAAQRHSFVLQALAQERGLRNKR